MIRCLSPMRNIVSSGVVPYQRFCVYFLRNVCLSLVEPGPHRYRDRGAEYRGTPCWILWSGGFGLEAGEARDAPELVAQGVGILVLAEHEVEAGTAGGGPGHHEVRQGAHPGLLGAER